MAPLKRYRTVPVRDEILPLLRAAEQPFQSAESPSGSVLFLLARATRRANILVAGHEAEAAGLWLGLACEPAGQVTHLVSPGHPTMDTAKLGLPVTMLPTPEQGPCYDMVVIVGESDTAATLVERLCPDGLLVLWGAGKSTPALAALAEENPAWRIVEAATSFVLAGPGARAPRFAESPREALIALLLQIGQPGTVVLGPDVVFDGAAKPPSSKISFSGMGGQIGIGDWLIVHPDDLGRFSPLPGAVAVVLGDVAAPIDAPHAALTLLGEEDQRVTFVVAMS